MSTDDLVCSAWTPGACEGTPHCPPRCPRFVDHEGQSWTIEPPREGDRAALAEMYDDFDPSQRAQGVPPIGDDRIASWLDGLLDDGCNFVARSGEQVVGHAVYVATDDPEPELAVFVHQDYQNRGLGTELCRHLIATAAAADRRALVLEVEPTNQNAIAVYEKLGFERVQQRTADDPLRRSRSFEMRLPLTDDRAASTQRPPVLGD
ncbi:Acetyltransferase (GNAT) family protein [Natronoarchaeum philippinense]|uniref:Acetyltransferase (GNAT) family protein n=1 Tax=Natronoarchaeum philippinense TaxID=558529 RepID=A0A285NCJ8_NATPI|nr:GNAT family N-acetyltransferase [Natronoarchaeum philippinense]SNZ06667.1 Acetyltransferase (GNAT) family protein [Natronoarchaeum philippinense]